MLEAVGTCVAAGAPGITVHPRADARHITAADVRDIARELAPLRGRVEFNIEGDPRPDFVELVEEVRPDQCTLVPVRPGEITSQAGWSAGHQVRGAADAIARCRAAGVRVSLFVDPRGRADSLGGVHRGAAGRAVHGALRPRVRGRRRWPRAHRSRRMHAPLAWPPRWVSAVNAGHDLDLDNLVLFRGLPHLEEVSIGHALVSHALFVGLDRSVREYLQVLAG